MLVEHTLWWPVLISVYALVHATLGAPGPVQSAMVWVGPPLLASSAGSRAGFVSYQEPFAVLKPHDVLSSLLWPPSVMLPKMPTAQLPPEALLATIVLLTIAV